MKQQSAEASDSTVKHFVNIFEYIYICNIIADLDWIILGFEWSVMHHFLKTPKNTNWLQTKSSLKTLDLDLNTEGKMEFQNSRKALSWKKSKLLHSK